MGNIIQCIIENIYVPIVYVHTYVRFLSNNYLQVYKKNEENGENKVARKRIFYEDMLQLFG